MDGYEVARRPRRCESIGNVELIAPTGWGSQQDQVLASQAGFDLHLVKPIALRQLRLHVESWNASLETVSGCRHAGVG